MRIKLLSSLLLLSFFSFNLTAQQQLIDVLSEKFTVNSLTALNGNTRNFAEVKLPDNATGFVYRLTVNKKGNGNLGNSLFTLLKQRGGYIAFGASLADFAIQNGDGNAVDAYIFTNSYDKDNFYAKNDRQWNYCKALPNRTNCCFSTNDCLGKRIYFGFRNNNTMQGLDVLLEVVAVIDSTGTQASASNTYSITNATDREISYEVSQNGLIWEKATIRAGYINNHTSPNQELKFRIFTGRFPILYILRPQERFRIIWDATKAKYDLVRF